MRHKIGKLLYFEYLFETFSDKISPQTGGVFTLTHRALLQLPIHNYITLNYDAGLTNARAALYPKATTSYYFWDQEDARSIRDRNCKRQVLHVHGRYDRADFIILTLNDYRRVYDNRAFVRLLEYLFAFKKLLIVGFGLSDPYVKQLFNNISGDYKKSPSRHIAFVGLAEKDLQRVNDALFIAADKSFRLWQAVLLVLRGRLCLQKFDKEHKNDEELLERIGDDGHETLKIAEQTGYIWPRVEALELLAADHQTRASLPGFNSQDEKDKVQSYSDEATSIKKGLFLTEKQMQELKAKARQEFEKQIAEWNEK